MFLGWLLSFLYCLFFVICCRLGGMSGVEHATGLENGKRRRGACFLGMRMILGECVSRFLGTFVGRFSLLAK